MTKPSAEIPHVDGAKAAPAGGDGQAVTDPDARNLQDQLAALQDKHIRLQADMDNYRKRLDRTVADVVNNRQAEFLRSLLPVVDNLARALHSAESDPANAHGFLEGVRLTQQSFLDVLKKHGVEPITAGGQFDPKYHEVVATLADPVRAEGEIVDVVRTGYRFEGVILRPAAVRVATKAHAEGHGAVDVKA